MILGIALTNPIYWEQQQEQISSGLRWERPPREVGLSLEKKYKTIERRLKDDPHFKKCYGKNKGV